MQEQRVIVRTEVVRHALNRDSLVEHAAQRGTINITGMHTKTNYAPSELVHDHEHSVGVQQNGLAMKKIDAPETDFLMAEKSQPRRIVTGIRSWSLVLFKYAPDNIFIDVSSKCFVDLLGYPGTAKPRVTPFQFDDGIDEFL
jgi:hypothetical protein